MTPRKRQVRPTTATIIEGRTWHPKRNQGIPPHMAKKFSETVKEEKARNRARADKLFDEKPKEDAAPKKRVLDDITAAGSNGPAHKDLKYHFGQLKGLKAKVDEASANYSNARKRAKEAGIDPAVLGHLMKIEKQDPLEVKIYFKQLDRAAQANGLEIQMDMFDSSGVSREAQIFDDGFKAGLAGKSTTDNPHDANTEAGQTWLSAWHMGQSRNVAGIGKTKADSLGALN